MATISTISSGNWSNPDIWNLGRVPADLDDVIISNGHTVIFDVYMDDTNFPNGLNSLKINGTSQTTILKASRETNTKLKFYGNIYGSNKTYSIFDWGKEDDYIPSNIQAEIVKNQAGKYIDGTNLKIYLYGADPGEIATTTKQYASAGSTTIYVNVPENFYLQAGDEILVEVEYKGDYTCIRTVQSFNPETGEVVLNSALPYDVDVGNYVLKLTRNLNLIDLIGDSNQSFIYNYILNNFVSWGNFRSKAKRFILLARYLKIKKAVFETLPLSSQDAYFYTFGSSYISKSILIGSGISDSWGVSLNDCFIFLTTKVYGGINFYFSKFLNALNAIYMLGYGLWKDIKIRNIFYLVKGAFGELTAKNINIEKIDSFMSGFIREKVFIYSDSDISSLIPDLLDINYTSPTTYFLMKGINTDNFVLSNRYGKGLKNTSIKRSLDYSVQFKLLTNISGTENPFMYLDFPLTASGDYTLSIYAQKDSNNTNAKIQIIEEETDNIVAESNTLSNTNTWEVLQVRYNFKKDKQYKIRLYAEGLGNVYWDVNPNDENYFQKQIEEKISKKIGWRGGWK